MQPISELKLAIILSLNAKDCISSLHIKSDYGVDTYSYYYYYCTKISPKLGAPAFLLWGRKYLLDFICYASTNVILFYKQITEITLEVVFPVKKLECTEFTYTNDLLDITGMPAVKITYSWIFCFDDRSSI